MSNLNDSGRKQSQKAMFYNSAQLQFQSEYSGVGQSPQSSILDINANLSVSNDRQPSPYSHRRDGSIPFPNLEKSGDLSMRESEDQK